ncbi:Prostasin [Trichinella murrelli]|uniref:Prostasin n=1 Tax=Trichinella murrelli TaxID=144512 RepID=A0A0V0TC19_9BILA|nr:Prostasin [Trichinella murrelli]
MMNEVKLQPDSTGVEIDRYVGGYIVCEYRESGVNAKDELYVFRCSSEKTCCGRECCIPSEAEVLPLWALILLLLLLFFLICALLGGIYYFCQKNKRLTKLKKQYNAKLKRRSAGEVEKNGHVGECEILINHAKPELVSVTDFESSVGTHREPSTEPCSSEHTQVMHMTSASTNNGDTVDSRRHGLLLASDKEDRTSDRLSPLTSTPIKETYERPPTPIEVTYHDDSDTGQMQRPQLQHIKTEEQKAQLIYYRPSVDKVAAYNDDFIFFQLSYYRHCYSNAQKGDTNNYQLLNIVVKEKLLHCNAYEERQKQVSHKNVEPVAEADNVKSLMACLSLCWEMRTGFGCYSVSYDFKEKICTLLEFIPKSLPLSSDMYIRRKYSVFAIPTNCTLEGKPTPAGTVAPPLLPPIKSYSNCGKAFYSPFTEATVNRITGGFETRPYSMPWTVSLQAHQTHQCGGTLIQFDPEVFMTDVILTAAHCVLERTLHTRQPDELNVVVSAHRLSHYEYGKQTIGVKRIIAHEHYNFSNPHSDIALVQLKSPVHFSRKAQPICLPSKDLEIKIGQLCTTVGWGFLKEETFHNDHLMQVQVPILNISKCATEDIYGKRVFDDKMICAGYMEGGRDACQGDSGGPLICLYDGVWVQQGVVSFGDGCGLKNKPGIYTKITTFRDWIDNALKELAKTRSTL